MSLAQQDLPVTPTTYGRQEENVLRRDLSRLRSELLTLRQVSQHSQLSGPDFDSNTGTKRPFNRQPP